MPKNITKKKDAMGFSEADLSGHLLNKNSVENIGSKNTMDTSNLINEDYQLYSALTVLEGLALNRT